MIHLVRIPAHYEANIYCSGGCGNSGASGFGATKREARERALADARKQEWRQDRDGWICNYCLKADAELVRRAQVFAMEDAGLRDYLHKALIGRDIPMYLREITERAGIGNFEFLGRDNKDRIIRALQALGFSNGDKPLGRGPWRREGNEAAIKGKV